MKPIFCYKFLRNSVLDHSKVQEKGFHELTGGGGGAAGVGRNAHGGTTGRSVKTIAQVPVGEVRRPLVDFALIARRVPVTRVGESGSGAIGGRRWEGDGGRRWGEGNGVNPILLLLRSNHSTRSIHPVITI